MFCYLLLSLSVAIIGNVDVCVGQYQLKPAQLSLLPPQGVRFAYPHDYDGITLVAFHYSINKPLLGVDAGDFNIDINAPADDLWIHDNIDIVVGNEDTVYYWYLTIADTIGYQETDLSWTPGTSGSEPPTIPPPTIITEPSPSPPTTTTTTTTTTTRPPGGTIPPGPGDACTTYPCLIFEDNFDTLNLDTWEHEITASGGGNWEFQYYTNNRSNSYVKDGNLFIKPTLTADKYDENFLTGGTLELWGGTPASECTNNAFWGCSRTGSPANLINPIQSARIRSVKSFAFTYGRVEIEAKMPTGDWIWPAIWMMPRYEEYGGWPASGEIDIVESRGNLDLRDETGADKGVNNAGSTCHWGPFWPYNGYEKTTKEKNDNFGNQFHKYRVEWDANEISFYYDNQLHLTVDPGAGGFWNYGDFGLPAQSNPWINSPNKLAPFDQEFYFIMNVAVGGTNGFFPDQWTNNLFPKPWTNLSPTAFLDFYSAKDQWLPTWAPNINNGEGAAMQVNYVRAWKLGPDLAKK